MRRALHTARLAGFEHPEVTDLLKEVDYGRLEGLTTDQIRETHPGWELYRDGSPGGETPAHIYARARAFVELATKRREGRAIATLNVLRDDGHHGRVIALWNAA
jgi:probable phosphoglycerate mutase